jgi:hypothetical protein
LVLLVLVFLLLLFSFVDVLLKARQHLCDKSWTFVKAARLALFVNADMAQLKCKGMHSTVVVIVPLTGSTQIRVSCCTSPSAALSQKDGGRRQRGQCRKPEPAHIARWHFASGSP